MSFSPPLSRYVVKGRGNSDELHLEREVEGAFFTSSLLDTFFPMIRYSNFPSDSRGSTPKKSTNCNGSSDA